MKGHGEKLSRNQEKAIAALITHNSILAAAESIGIGEVISSHCKLPTDIIGTGPSLRLRR